MTRFSAAGLVRRQVGSCDNDGQSGELRQVVLGAKRSAAERALP